MRDHDFEQETAEIAEGRAKLVGELPVAVGIPYGWGRAEDAVSEYLKAGAGKFPRGLERG